VVRERGGAVIPRLPATNLSSGSISLIEGEAMRDDNRLLLSSWSEMTVRRDRIGDRPCCDQNLSIIGPPTWKHGGGFRCRLCDRNVGWIKHSCAEIIRERLAAGEPMPFSMKEIEEAALAKSCPPSAPANHRR
jgi:hypothetical protein